MPSLRHEYFLPDLAYVHHAGFGEFGASAARRILRLLRERGIHSGRIVELGCGSGIASRILLRKGYSLSGVDSSPAMIQLARKNNPRGRFTVGSLWTYRLTPCEAVIAVGECLNYEFDGRNSSSRIRHLFSNVCHVLSPGGCFVFDLLLQSTTKNAKGQKFVEGGDWFVSVDRSERLTGITRRIVCFRKSGDLYRKTVEIHHQKKYNRATVESLLRETGFKVRTLHGYGGRSPGNHHLVFVADRGGQTMHSDA